MHNNSSYILSPEQLLKSSKITRTQNQGWIQDLDPLLQGHMKVVYTKTIPIQIRQVNQQGRQIGIRQMMNFRFFVSPLPNSQYSGLTIQINNDTNIFFTYVQRIDQKKFQKIKKQQGLNFNFNQLLPMLVKQLQLCDKNINQYAAIFYLNTQNLQNNPRLDFIQNIQYKRIQLISFQLESLNEEVLKQYVTYRFTKLKKMNQLTLSKIKTVISQVKLKNPKLLKNILERKDKNTQMTSSV